MLKLDNYPRLEIKFPVSTLINVYRLKKNSSLKEMITYLHKKWFYQNQNKFELYLFPEEKQWLANIDFLDKLCPSDLNSPLSS